MINQDNDIQKTKFLPPNSAEPWNHNGQMLRDIKESLSHLRQEKSSVLSTSSGSGLPNVCAQASYQSATSPTYLLSSSKCHPMQIKSDFASGGTVQQNTGLGTTNPNGVILGAYSGGVSDSRVAGAVKSAHYRQKALAEIRNSLEPFANKLELSSSSSNASDSSGFSQTIDSVSSCPNGLDKDKLHNPEDILSSMGYKDLAFRFLNLSVDKNEEASAGREAVQKANGCKKTTLTEAPNGLTRYAALSKINLKHLQKSTAGGTQPDSGWEGSQSQFGTGSATDSVRSDSPGASAGLSDAAGVRGRGAGPGRPGWKRRGPAALPADESPPPPPPPRGAAAPPPVPPDGPAPPRPLPPLPSVSRAEGPVPFGGSAHPHLARRLRRLGVCSSGGSPSEEGDLPPPYPAVPGGSPSARSSPPPASGRPAPSFLRPRKRTPPPAYPSSSSSSGSGRGPRPPPPCGVAGPAAAAVVTTVGPVPHFSYLQSWSSRQAKSQSPVIMHSVKSTHVQKPVLQTAVAPTSPPAVRDAVSESSRAGHSNVCLSARDRVGLPPYFNVRDVGASSDLPSYPLCSPGTDSAPPPPPYSITARTRSATRDSDDGPKQRRGWGVSGCEMLQSARVPPSVPTTEPPSYACGVAALAVQRATSGAGSNAPVGYVSTRATSSRPDVGVPSVLDSSHLVNTAESIRTSQSTAIPCGYDGSVNNNWLENHSYFLPQPPPPLPRKPAPDPPDVFDSANGFGSRPESPCNANRADSGRERRTPPPPPYKKTMHQSPIPPRKVLSREMEEERRETKIRNFSPTAFKFYMEQHIENLLKSHQQRIHRRQQLETEMAKVGLSEEAQNQMRLMLHQKESNYIRLKRAKMKRSMFVKLKTVGIGAFGEVALVRKVDTRQLYAMKTLRKADVFKRNQAAHVKAERDILAEADNEWVVKLYYSFQDKDNLYFVMDYIPGGDLMSLLIKFGIFQESLARFYITELVVAIESVHKMGFIHRDIKPDNILIDADGHIKLTDFGLCTGFRWTHNSKYYQRNGEHNRQDSMDPDENWNNECHCKSMKPLERKRHSEHQRCLAHSLVGTPNYIAPEVLLRTGYTQQCDWWSVGVILYEMLVGQPPFFANTPAETQLKVINWETTLHIPKAANLSKEATDIILKLCCGPEKRLGKNGTEEIKSHPFFENVDFNGDLRKQPAPYKPIISSPTDTSNFDPIDPDKLRSSDYSDDEKNRNELNNTTHPEHAFFEFTFRRFFDDGGQAYPVKIPMEETFGYMDNGDSAIYTDSTNSNYGEIKDSSSYTDDKKPPVYV
ncbi:serine/threonine-protein kinase LATS1-like [Centruroides sculpturatus]|uniref:serine/threonine-protein kinase LATS1-like n=1 Tax=Centruroides sculpturatus TaxID=218467 RepID=UPI000C6E1DA2|nr:serine/threonine-protein kinase LATS1-like [Centruroides sculpturatus]XP_023223650.1 serine/threonine-protein kinase LATS1-like [Centruroides sculpturatus]